MEERIYPTFKIEVLDNLLSDEGIETQQLLAGTTIVADSIRSSDTRITREELVTVYQNARRLTPQPGRLAFNAGAQLRLASYGMYGFAMMTSPNFRHALDFSIRYHQLATPTVLMSLSVDDDDEIAVMRIQDVLHLPELQVFNLELQFSLIQSLSRDMVSDDFCFESISTTYRQPEHHQDYETSFGCPIYFNQTSNEMRFKEWWLRQPLRNANPITADLTQQVCDKVLATMQPRKGTAEAVNALLSQNLRRYHNIEPVAAQLNISSRTLRRKLTDEQVSFQDLQRETRERFAIAFLRETNMSIEDIAEQLGFSEAANFRRAFKQWTGRVPSSYRS